MTNLIFEQNCSYEQASLILLGTPWEVTVSYATGTVHGPRWIQKASSQLDFFDLSTHTQPSKEGLHFLCLDSLKIKNDQLRPLALNIIQNIESSQKSSTSKDISLVNQGCTEMVEAVQQNTKKILNDKKLFGLIGGDHSVSEGALLEIGQQYQGDFGLLHFDAHADMRVAYQGFTHSHASVMYNVLKQKFPPQSIVQVGLRDLCKEEYNLIQSNKNIHAFFDHEIKKKLFLGETWNSIVDSILEKLPHRVYISLDVDALSWNYAPHTGCPVPGGLSFDHMIYLFDKIAQTNKEIIGFDVVEVAKPSSQNLGEWDGNVGARLVYKLCALSLLQKEKNSK